MRAIAIGWQGALLGNLLLVALFLFRNSPLAWAIIGCLIALQGLLTVWVLFGKRESETSDSTDLI